MDSEGSGKIVGVPLVTGNTYYCIDWKEFILGGCEIRLASNSFQCFNYYDTDYPSSSSYSDTPAAGAAGGSTGSSGGGGLGRGGSRVTRATVPVGMIVGVSIGGFFLLLGVVLGTLVWYRRRKQQQAADNGGEYTGVPLGDVMETPGVSSFNVPTLTPVYVATNVPY